MNTKLGIFTIKKECCVCSKETDSQAFIDLFLETELYLCGDFMCTKTYNRESGD